jgi:hypothetical protein
VQWKPVGDKRVHAQEERGKKTDNVTAKLSIYVQLFHLKDIFDLENT